MNYYHKFLLISTVALGACSSSSGTTVPFVGNGLPFAVGGEALSDVEGQEMTVKLAQVYFNAADDTTRLVITDEKVTLGAGYVDGPVYDMTITIDGVTYVIEDDVGQFSNGQEIYTYTYHDDGTYSRVDGVYSYALGADTGFEFQSLFVFGYQTDPDVIAAKVGSASFTGTFDGYGNSISLDGTLVDYDVYFGGSLNIDANFDTNRVSGDYSGEFTVAGYDSNFSGLIPEVDLVANGFTSTLDTACPIGSTCSGGGDILGTFFGNTGQEVGGILTIDHTVDDGIDGYQFTGVAGFSAD
jgi:hypothetical protein